MDMSTRSPCKGKALNNFSLGRLFFLYIVEVGKHCNDMNVC